MITEGRSKVDFLDPIRYDGYMMLSRLLERIGLKRKQSWLERHFILVLIIAAAIFMTISICVGLQQSVWFDEAYSIMLAKQPVDQLIHLTSVDTHPPLYYLLLKAWALVFGWSELALRSLSVLAAGGAVVFGGLLVKRTFGVRAALATLPFVVFAPFLLRYGFEIRMYALASLIGIAATLVLVCAVGAKNTRQQWQLYAVYGALVALGIYTLYYLAVLWIAHVVWLVWLARRQKKTLFKQPWLVAYVGGALLFVPWLPLFVAQLTNGALAPIAQPLTVSNLTGIVSFMFLYQPSWELNALMSLVIVFVIAAVAYFAVQASRIVSPQQKQHLVLMGLYVVVPITIVALVSIQKPLYVERYLAHVIIGGSLFVGVAVWTTLQKKADRKIRFAAAGLLAVMVIGTVHLAQVGNYNFQRLQKPDVKQAAAAIGECRQGRTILANDPYVAIELAYYMPQCDIHFYSEWPTLGGGYAPLSGNPLQVTDPARQLVSSNEIIYVHYGQSQLQMPDRLQKTADQTVGSMQIETFRLP
jgi:mannosyltransferase